MKVEQDLNQNQNSPEISEKMTKKPPFLVVEHVKLTRFGYKAGENYKESHNCSVILTVAKSYTEADLMLFYELRGSGIKFNRYSIAKIIQYHIQKISFNQLNLICYEFNK